MFVYERNKLPGHFFVFYILLNYGLFARHVQPDEIRLAANRFINDYVSLTYSDLQKSSVPQVRSIEPYFIRNRQEEEAAYVVRLSPEGFIVFSYKTDSPPVIAYSFSSYWQADTTLNNPIGHLIHRSLQRSFTDRSGNDDANPLNHEADWQELLQLTPDLAESEPLQQWPEPGTTVTGGWIETLFSQLSPFNDFCPIDPFNGKRSAVGCVATAMAQIIHHHRRMNYFNFSPVDRYFTLTRAICIDEDSTSADFPSFFRLNQYLEILREKYQNQTGFDDYDFAALSFACGVSVEMDFSSATSSAGTDQSAEAFRDKFQYVNAQYIYFDTDNSAAEFYRQLKNNMMNGLPAILSIRSDLSGHAVVCDGYNTDGFYHLNYGSGSKNPIPIGEAWFHIPESLGSIYNEITGGVVNIQPDLGQSELVFGTDSLDLGIVQVGQSSGTLSLTVMNTSHLQISVNNIQVSHPFIASATPDFAAPVTVMEIAPRQTRSIYLQFQPDKTGEYARDLVINYDNGSRFLPCVLTGYGIQENSTAVQEKYVSGIWTKDESPYFIFSSIEIPKSHSLVIEAGVEIIFTGNYMWIIGEEAQLLCQGVSSDPVFIHAMDSTRHWQGLLFTDSGTDDSLFFCQIQHIFEDNISDGVLRIRQCSPFFSHCRFDYNQSQWQGVLDFSGSSAYLESCVFTRNKVYDGVIQAFDSNLRMDHSLIIDNQVEGYGLISLYKSTLSIYHGTLTENRSNRLFHLNSDSHIKIRNTIIWQNQTNGMENGDNYGLNMFDLDYSNFDTMAVDWKLWQNNDQIILNLGKFNIFSDPNWNENATLPFQLSSLSPCIDAGDPMCPVANEPFPHGFRVNLGVYGGTENAQTTSGPALSVDPFRLDFGERDQPEMVNEKLYLLNGGTESVQITRIRLADAYYFQFINAANQNMPVRFPINVLPGQMDSVQIVFDPDDRYSLSYQDTLFIASSLPDNVFAIVQGSARIGTDIESGELKALLEKKNSPYHIYSNVTVPSGKTTVIEPGVICYFMDDFSLTVESDGCLKAEGSVADSIYFCSFDPSRIWCGINMIHSKTSNAFSYCVFKHCERPLYEYPTNAYHSSLNGDGALFMDESVASVRHSRFADNRGRSGGAIYSRNSDVTIRDCRFESNSANRGGAIYVTLSPGEESKLSIRNVLLFNNHAYDCGGGMYLNMSGQICGITNALICRNSAADHGGGICLAGMNTLIMQNSILWQNEASRGNEISLDGSNNMITIQYTTVDTLSDNWCVLYPQDYSYGEITPTIQIGEGNLTEDPAFTDPDRGFFTLQSHSPCIDAGHPDSDYRDVEDPERAGFALYPAAGTLRNDMGAFGGGVISESKYLFFYPGWQLVGISVNQSAFNWKDNFSQGTRAYVWDADMCHYREADTLQRRQGFWLKTEIPFEDDVQGAPIYADSMHLTPGWHLVSGISRVLPVTSIQTIPGYSMVAVYAWDAELQTYEPAESIEPGRGYWFAIARDCYIIFDSEREDYFYLPKSEGRIASGFFTKHGNLPPPPPGIVAEATMPKVFRLRQNYPNPFNGTTVIFYEIPRVCHVRIQIYNVLGRQINTLVDKLQEPGRYLLSWEGADDRSRHVSTGLYFCTMKAGDDLHVMKMLRIK
ncbi:C10 family peptidase [bacterium]|nr:C10 family peptidase [bacterium]